MSGDIEAHDDTEDNAKIVARLKVLRVNPSAKRHDAVDEEESSDLVHQLEFLHK